MPYIMLKPANSIADGTVQLLDVSPNASQRNAITDPAARTGYLREGDNDPCELLQPGGTTNPVYLHKSTGGAADGLTAYLIDTLDAFDSGANERVCTVAEASGAADGIINILNANTALTKATINNAIQAVTIGVATPLSAAGIGENNSSSSVADILDILAGRIYRVPEDSKIADSEAASSGFDPKTDGAQGSFVSGTKKIATGSDLYASIISGGLAGLQAASLRGTQYVATDSGSGAGVSPYPYRGGASVNRGHAPQAPLTAISASDIIAIYDDDGTLIDS